MVVITAVIIHVFGHDITAYSSGRAKHDNDRNQHIMGKSQKHSQWKKYSFISHKLQKATCDQWFRPCECLAEFQCATHGHQPKRSRCFSEIIYGSIQNCWHWQMKQRPYHTCQDTKDNRVRGDSFQGSDKLCGIKFTAAGSEQ